ncbi:MAG: rhomboid family intramembrane serine protease [Candidatus Kerfeldbacteria bacterium]|nr:rhomboid family intramembrane serine protease [Candidatus Kerfeldbacteria bacterium]
MIPIRDHNPSGRRPFVTYGLLATNIVVFVYMMTLGAAGLEGFINSQALIPADIVRGLNLQTLITSMFLHGSMGHIVGNMIFLHIFGDNLEDRFGHLRFMLFYLLAGLAGSALQIVIDPSSTIPNLGASGAIAGVMGGYLVLYPRHRIDVLWGFYGVSSVPASFMLGYWILFQFFGGFGSLGLAGGGVAYFAHIGGFALGYLLTRLAVSRQQPTVKQIR